MSILIKDITPFTFKAVKCKDLNMNAIANKIIAKNIINEITCNKDN